MNDCQRYIVRSFKCYRVRFAPTTDADPAVHDNALTGEPRSVCTCTEIICDDRSDPWTHNRRLADQVDHVGLESSIGDARVLLVNEAELLEQHHRVNGSFLTRIIHHDIGRRGSRRPCSLPA